MKLLTAMSLIPLLVLTGCTADEHHLFEGKSRNWEVAFEAELNAGERQQTDGTVRYIGKGSVPERISYKIQTPSMVSSGRDIQIAGRMATIGRGSCENCLALKKNDELTVTIKWAGLEETVQLKSVE